MQSITNGRKLRAPRNRTLTLTPDEVALYRGRLVRLDRRAGVEHITNATICQDVLEVIDWLPPQSVDLLFLDPPYNLTRAYNRRTFRRRPADDYAAWFETWFGWLLPILKPSASVYICCDWRTSGAVQRIAEGHLIVRSRITWEREKGRGAKRNWKNCAEDIWFCTMSDTYTFNVEAVKLKRRVIAPYTDADGQPRDWARGTDGSFRLTHPSNLWTDLTVPFWSMPENTDHPTQKPEKLVAKIILASTHPGDLVLDPFLGSGTTSVVAKKLGRRWSGIEIDETYCCLAEKRLALAEHDRTIQGYNDGVFWERNANP